MSDNEQITFEGTKYAGAVKVKAATTGMGEEKKLARGSAVAFIGQGTVVGVAFREAGGINVREHITTAEELRVVPGELVEDIIEELREDESGQPRLLSIDGESRRAARRAVRARQEAIEAGQSVEADDALEVSDFIGAVETLLEPVRATNSMVDDFEQVSHFYEAVEENLVAVAERAVAAVESMHRRRCQAVEDERQAAEEAERERARAQAAAAAVSDDPVADSEAAALNRDDGLVQVGEAAVAAVPDYDPDDEDDAPVGGDLEVEHDEQLEEHQGGDAEDERTPSTPQQRVAISRQIMAMSGSERLASEWGEWCDRHDTPRTPSEMTFDQAKAALIFLGDAENAEAGAVAV